MAQESKSKPKLTEDGAEAAKRREARLAAALRANLGRRKAQARGRAEAASPAAPEEPSARR